MKIDVKKADDVLYEELVKFLQEIKVVQGGSTLAAKLLKHKGIMNFLRRKQHEKMEFFETSYFNPDGTVDMESAEDLLDSVLCDKL